MALLVGACASPRPGYDLPPAGRIELAAASLDPISRYRAILDRAKPYSVAFTPTAREQLSGTGKLRAAINYGNSVLAARGADGAPRGVSVDIAQELARQLMVPVSLVPYVSAAQTMEGLRRDEWDIAFFAIDAARANEAAFTAPYLFIEGAYAVPVKSLIARMDQIDQPGVRVVVGLGSAYDLHLTRTFKRASLVRVKTSPVVADELLKGGFEAAAGLRPQLEADSKRLSGMRVLDGNFMRIEQALAVPRGKTEAQGMLNAFLEV
ncbi:MAG: transporter substrate-binding domain-containing protein, partial [Betaproteobacteria bacterium]|nr:transporter substrate-binding domain-containing protein [Betaproteobacteria bacterium]